MQKITLEEHFQSPEFEVYEKNVNAVIDSAFAADMGRRLEDFADLRLKAMDEGGIEISVLSQTTPGVHMDKDAALAIRRAKESNDFQAGKVATNPNRFRGFAHLSMHDPKEAIKELTRCVNELKFVGAMVNGHTNGVYLDDPMYEDFWETVETLDVPIYLHPVDTWGMPAMLEGQPELLGAIWTWTLENATHTMRLIISGLFDRHPKLKIILGHMGETLPFSLWRLDSRWKTHNNPHAKLKMLPSEYIKRNIIITTSGVCDNPPLICSMQSIGVDNILFSVDYPFESSAIAAHFIETAPISEQEREKICHLNARRILKI